MAKTKEKIAALGEELIRERGYNAFSYHDIAETLGIKNAAVHYHFPSKEQLGADILRKSQQKFNEMVDRLEQQRSNEWEKLEAFMAIFRKNFLQQQVCLIGALSPEYLTLGKDMQQELQNLVEGIFEWLTKVLRSGKEKGYFDFNIEPEVKGLMLLTNMLGGLQLVRVSSKMNFEAIYQGILQELKPLNVK